MTILYSRTAVFVAHCWVSHAISGPAHPFGMRITPPHQHRGLNIPLKGDTHLCTPYCWTNPWTHGNITLVSREVALLGRSSPKSGVKVSLRAKTRVWVNVHVCVSVCMCGNLCACEPVTGIMRTCLCVHPTFPYMGLPQKSICNKWFRAFEHRT